MEDEPRVVLRSGPTGAPPVAVVMPLHNAGNGVRGALAQLQRMAPETFHLVVIDDGSTDDTVQNVLEVAEHFPVVTVVAQENTGVAEARNRALTFVENEYVWFLDWDDEWETTTLAYLLGAATSTDADVVVCRAVHVREGETTGPLIDGSADPTTISGEEAFIRLLGGEIRGYLWSKLIRRSVLGDNPFPDMRSLSDLAGLIPVVARSERVTLIPQTLVRHVVREGSITNTRRSARLENFDRCHAVATQTARRWPDDARVQQALRRYELEFWHLASVQTGLRLGAPPEEMRNRVGAARKSLTPRSLVTITRRSPFAGLKLIALYVTGHRYPSVYRAVIESRNRRK